MTSIKPALKAVWHPVDMFISVKRHEREKQDVIGASNRLTDAILKSSVQGMFLLDAKDKKIELLEAKLIRKNEVVAELLEAHTTLIAFGKNEF